MFTAFKERFNNGNGFFKDSDFVMVSHSAIFLGPASALLDPYNGARLHQEGIQVLLLGENGADARPYSRLLG